MDGETRRADILKLIQESDTPVSGARLAERFKISRQVIVQDIAVLRAADNEIISTNRGYICRSTSENKEYRVFKVQHDDSRIMEELNVIVDYGGIVEDVFVNHKVYGKMNARLMISSRKQVNDFVENIKAGKSKPLNNITSGYHYHTVQADSREILDLIKEELEKKGFLIQG